MFVYAVLLYSQGRAVCLKRERKLERQKNEASKKKSIWKKSLKKRLVFLNLTEKHFKKMC